EDAATYRQNLILNDGFTHRKNIYNEYIYDSKSFYRSIYNTGNFYNYSVELPTINLIKLHGSLSWKKESDDVYYKIPPIKPIRFEDSQNQKDWINQHALVLPRKEKFKETVLENIYYDLLRTYSNELDKEGTLLIVFGFSFADEHIELLTKKALRNTTLKLMIFAYNESSTKFYNDKFKDFANVEIVYLKDEDMDLGKFCSILEII
ncbi:SIR2 family protein, partial [Gilliamella sp. wkB108]|uniref:SIR2 family protein n=1 Tax=Gilliamella sp. wkB108 TaxID=3120256 RepID=UPI000AC0921E